MKMGMKMGMDTPRPPGSRDRLRSADFCAEWGTATRPEAHSLPPDLCKKAEPKRPAFHVLSAKTQDSHSGCPPTKACCSCIIFCCYDDYPIIRELFQRDVYYTGSFSPDLIKGIVEEACCRFHHIVQFPVSEFLALRSSFPCDGVQLLDTQIITVPIIAALIPIPQ